MHIKRFVGATLEQALAGVRAELGPDALILNTRSVRRDGGVFGWLGRSSVEVLAAVERERVAPEPERYLPRAAPAAQRARKDPSWQGLSLSKALVDPLEAELRSLRRAVDELRGERATQEELRDELRALRGALVHLASVDGESPGPEAPGAGSPAAACLRAFGVASECAREIAAEAQARAREQGGPVEAQLRPALAGRLEGSLQTPRPGGDGRATLFVGAPGTGKTTSLAKIAGRPEALPQAPAIVSADVMRAGAHEALRGYAARIGVEFDLCSQPDELAEKLGAWGRRHLLVDTAGRSDPAGLPELCDYRRALGRRAEVHLVLAATTKESDLRAQLRRYRRLEPDALILTRVDESEELGNIANLLLDPATPPLAWICTGQRVPEDLELPDPEALADRILGGPA